MKNFVANVLIIAASLLLASCGVVGSSGKAADPPVGGINVVAGDSQVKVTWLAQSGVQYWLTYATNLGAVTSTNSNSFPGGGILMDVSSPLVVPKLINGTTYYFTMDARTNGGPGGPDTPAVWATPHFAGIAPSSWNAGAALGTNDLRGVTYGTTFVAVGAGGALFTSPDGIAWTQLKPVVAGDLNAVLYSVGTYVAIGAGGAILGSADGVTWQIATSPTTSALNGIASNGAGVFFFVGANGTIVSYSSAGGGTVVKSGTTNNLNAVADGAGTIVAVGSGGVILTSYDGVNWAAAVSGTSADLNGVAFGTNQAGTSQFVAVGAAGTVVTSPNGITWTVQPAITSNDLAAVAMGSLFVAVGAGGKLYTSMDGITWTAQASGTTNDLKAATFGNGGYAAVGAAGANLTSY